MGDGCRWRVYRQVWPLVVAMVLLGIPAVSGGVPSMEYVTVSNHLHRCSFAGARLSRDVVLYNSLWILSGSFNPFLPLSIRRSTTLKHLINHFHKHQLLFPLFWLPSCLRQLHHMEWGIFVHLLAKGGECTPVKEMGKGINGDPWGRGKLAVYLCVTLVFMRQVEGIIALRWTVARCHSPFLQLSKAAANFLLTHQLVTFWNVKRSRQCTWKYAQVSTGFNRR